MTIKICPMQRPLQVVDPVVSERKFQQEVDAFLEGSNLHRKRGIIVLECRFPDIKLAFCAPNVRPIPIAFAVNINYTNYDLEPLSVKFINPLTFELLRTEELNHLFRRRNDEVVSNESFQNLLIGGKDGKPFICLPGIREYHIHPDHSNVPWLSLRGKGGEGTLGFIVDKLYQYGIAAITGYTIPLAFHRLPLGLDPQKIPT